MLRPDIQPWAESQVKGIMGACGAVIHEQEMTNHFLLHNTIQMLFTKKVSSSVQNATMVQLYSICYLHRY